ncbi:MAG TPA: hypothetical protein VGO25_01325, partial [Rhodanobacteraceae bacterium]|nr:hypothetical protein [Rhodanobacteraceae bacterium]
MALFINGVKYSEGSGKFIVLPVKVGEYLRRLRIRVVGYDAQGNVAGEDEMVVNDPKPPFRIRLHANRGALEATVVKPQQLGITAVDFFIGEETIATVKSPPYAAEFDAAKYPNAVYARVVAHGNDGSEANDVLFFGTNPSEQVDVAVQQLPLSVVGGNRAPQINELT